MKIRWMLVIWMIIAGYLTTVASVYETISGNAIPGLRFETIGPLYFGEGDIQIINTLEVKYHNKISVMRFISEDINVTITDPGQDGYKDLVYYKVIDHRGVDITNLSVQLFSDNNDLAIKAAREEGIITSTGLSVGDYILIDFYDRQTDTLLYSYCLAREKVHLQTTNSNMTGKEIELLPGAEKTIQFMQAKGSKEPLSLSYRVTTSNGITLVEDRSKDQITLSGLSAGQNYTLTIWSSFVPEAEFSEQFYIRVRPYWYQTSIFHMGVLVIFLLGSWIGFLLVMRRRVRVAENKRIETEQKLLSMQAQLNPHFVFNALNSIKGLNSTGQIDKANRYLGTFSTLLRNTLKSSRQISHSLEQELATLSIYLELEKLRFGFNWVIEVPETLNTSTIDIPTLLLQPLVENAVKHGVSTLGNNGMVTLRVFDEGVDLVIEIADNGPSFPYDGDHQGFGIRLTKERIQVFNSLSKENQILLKFEHREGTVVRITLSNWFT